MPPPRGPLQLGAHTSVPRHQAIPATHDALTEGGAILEDLHEYSNRMTTYRFEMAHDQLAAFGRALVAAGIALDGWDPETIEATARPRADSEGFVLATLSLSLPHEDGDRHNPNPDRG